MMEKLVSAALQVTWSDELAVHYSWQGQKGKSAADSLELSNLIIGKYSRK